MANQSAFSLNTQKGEIFDIFISQKDKGILRDLAAHLADLAARPVEDEKRKLWLKHNKLEPTRPVIFCDPENGWNEIITEKQLLCEGELARRWEMTLDMWGFGESQETTQVSPSMFEEFIFPYQLPILERFGLNCYGCCEPLNKRWYLIKKIPRLRRVSISPWADLHDMAEKLGSNYIYIQ